MLYIPRGPSLEPDWARCAPACGARRVCARSAICAVATVNSRALRFHHHAPELLPPSATRPSEAWRRRCRRDAHLLFDRGELAARRLAVEMTRSVRVGDAVFDEARSALADDSILVELVATIAAYNMVSRVIVALGIEPEAATP